MNPMISSPDPGRRVWIDWIAACAIAFVVAGASVRAADPPPAAPPSAPAQRSAADLEKLVMPIALHPDPLIAIVLPAAVYPLEIVQAARFLKDTNNVATIDAQPWDENVRALAKFPDMLARMDADLGWTVDLGQAFLDQPKELMDTIQSLRAKAHTAGTLQSTAQQVVTVTNVVVIQTNVTQVVTVTNQVVQVQPADPQVVYVPTYPPTVYYPPPAYVYNPYAPLVTFGVGVAVGAIIANNCDWHGGGIYVGGGGMVVWGGGGHSDVDIDIDSDINIDRNTNIDRGNRPTPQSGNRAGGATSPTTTQKKWQPDQNRLRTSGAGSAAPSAGTREARGWGSPPASTARPATPSTRPASPAARPAVPSARPATPTARPAAPSTGAIGQRPATAAPAARPSAQPQGVNRPAPAPSPSVNRAPAANRSGSSAFGGVNSGGMSRSYSNRGAASRGGGGFRGGGRR